MMTGTDFFNFFCVKPSLERVREATPITLSVKQNTKYVENIHESNLGFNGYHHCN